MTDTITKPPVTTSTEVVPFAPSVRTIARQQGIDLPGLLSILELRRPDQSQTESDFANALFDSLPDGKWSDGFGNIIFDIGDKPNVMWSCHTDTVSKEGGRQNLKWNGDVLSLNQGKAGQSLGADDGAGLWLLLEMIKAGKPGRYVFHRAEEVGRLGSKHISDKEAKVLEGITIAIAFDRRGTDSIITHQSGRRTCSDAFAEKLGAAFGTNFKKDPTGSYTDTYSYVDQVSECTNVSVGYTGEHGPRETLDVAHVFKLREALLALDTSILPVERDASKTEWEDDGWGGYGFGQYRGYTSGSSGAYGNNRWGQEMREVDEIEAMIKKNPRLFARWFHDAKMDADVLECMFGSWARPKKSPAKASAEVFEKEAGSQAAAAYFRTNQLADADLADEDETEIFHEPGILCHDCAQAFEAPYDIDPRDGDDCPQCLGVNTEACTVAIDAVSGEVVDA